jgi:hypothetical protein
MRTDTKTNISSLAATAGAVAFVAWIASFGLQPDSIYATPPRAATVAMSHQAAARAADQAVTHGQG